MVIKSSGTEARLSEFKSILVSTHYLYTLGKSLFSVSFSDIHSHGVIIRFHICIECLK